MKPRSMGGLPDPVTTVARRLDVIGADIECARGDLPTLEAEFHQTLQLLVATPASSLRGALDKLLHSGVADREDDSKLLRASAIADLSRLAKEEEEAAA